MIWICDCRMLTEGSFLGSKIIFYKDGDLGRIQSKYILYFCKVIQSNIVAGLVSEGRKSCPARSLPLSYLRGPPYGRLLALDDNSFNHTAGFIMAWVKLRRSMITNNNYAIDISCYLSLCCCILTSFTTAHCCCPTATVIICS